MALEDRYWWPARRLQYNLMGGALTLVLRSREQTLHLLRDIPDRLAATAALTEAWPRINRELAWDMIALMRWGFEQLAGIQADIGIQEHNTAFAPAVRRGDFAFGDQMREDVEAAFSNRRDYLPNLSDTIWGSAARRDNILHAMVDLVESDANAGPMALAGAMEKMWAPVQEGPRWMWSRMQVLSPKGRAKSRLGLLPPGSAQGESYNHLRVVRTEIAGMQQEMAKHRYQVQPWVEGIDWTLSPGHPKVDICDTYADRNPYPKNAVPMIPHPNCLCVLTPVLMPAEKFTDATLAWAAGENGFLDDYADFIADKEFLRQYPIPETGGLRAWQSKLVPQDPLNLQGLKTKWAPGVQVSDEALAIWEKARGRVAKVEPPKPKPAPKPKRARKPRKPKAKKLHEMNADEALAYLRGSQHGQTAAAGLAQQVKKLEERLKSEKFFHNAKLRNAREGIGIYGPDQQAKAKARQKEISKEIRSLKAKEKRAVARVRKEMLAPKKLSDMPLQVDLHNITGNFKTPLELVEQRLIDNARRNADDFQRMVKVPDDGIIHRARIDNHTTRASYSGSASNSRANLGQFDDDRTHIHEWGHMLEARDAAKRQKAHEFLRRRTAGDAGPVRIKDIPGYEYYNPEEMTLKDQFNHPYIGRYYVTNNFPDSTMSPNILSQVQGQGKNIYGTEITSMGLDAMWQNAAKFAADDEDYFRFIWTEIMDRK